MYMYLSCDSTENSTLHVGSLFVCICMYVCMYVSIYIFIYTDACMYSVLAASVHVCTSSSARALQKHVCTVHWMSCLCSICIHVYDVHA